MAVNWIESEIIEHTHWTDTLSSLRFKGKVLPYTAGQFTKVGLKINGEVVSETYGILACLADLIIMFVTSELFDRIASDFFSNLGIL